MKIRLSFLIVLVAVVMVLSACDSAANTAVTCTHPSASSADKLIYYLDKDNLTIRSIWPDGNACRDILKVADPARQIASISVSSDGKYIAYSLKDNGGYFLFSNGNTVKLAGIFSLPLWYQHTFVAITGQGNAQSQWSMFDADRDAIQPIRNFNVKGNLLSWYPDRSSVLCQDQDSNLYRIDLSDASAQPISTTLVTFNPKGQDNYDPERWRIGTLTLTQNEKIMFVGAQVKNIPAQNSLSDYHLWLLDPGSGKDSLTSLADVQSISMPYFVLLNPNTILLDYMTQLQPYGIDQHVAVLTLDFKGKTKKIATILPAGPSSVGPYASDYSPAAKLRFLYTYHNCDIAPADGCMNVYNAEKMWTFDGHDAKTTLLPEGSYYYWVNFSSN